MDNASMITVTIKDDDANGPTEVTCSNRIGEQVGDANYVLSTSEALGLAISHALLATQPARMDLVIATLIDSLMENGQFAEDGMCWTGQSDAVEKLAKAARAIIQGWKKTDG